VTRTDDFGVAKVVAPRPDPSIHVPVALQVEDEGGAEGTTPIVIRMPVCPG
jgi:hypothetical protein